MHTTFRKNKRVLLHMKDGRKIVGKFQKSEGKYVWLKGMPEFRKNKIRAISIYKGGR